MFGEKKENQRVNMEQTTRELKVTRAQFAVLKESIMQKMKEVMSRFGIVCDELDSEVDKRNCFESLIKSCEEKYQKLLELFGINKEDSNS